MIDFMRYKIVYFSLSLAVILPGLFSLIRFGLRPGIDFTGGSRLEVKFISGERPKLLEIRESLPKDFGTATVQLVGEETVIVKTMTITKEQAQAIKDGLATKFGEVEEVLFETVGPIVGKELLQKTVVGVSLAAGLIMLYVMYRFNELKYGVCAILAMLHDSLILLGSFSLLGHFYGIEVDGLFVTAVLTVLSFSVHDTIVVYDRIRESRKKRPKEDFVNLVNVAVGETLGRSVNNSMTIIFMLLALLLLGGETIRWFVLALLLGTITGTYSSPFTAVPLLVVWEKWLGRQK